MKLFELLQIAKIKGLTQGVVIQIQQLQTFHSGYPFSSRFRQADAAAVKRQGGQLAQLMDFLRELAQGEVVERQKAQLGETLQKPTPLQISPLIGQHYFGDMAEIGRQFGQFAKNVWLEHEPAGSIRINLRQ